MMSFLRKRDFVIQNIHMLFMGTERHIKFYFSLDGCSIYVTHFCHECVKLIIQSGIKEIVYMDEKYADTESDIGAKRMPAANELSHENMKIIVEDEE